MADRDVSSTEPDLKVRPGALGVNVDDDPVGRPAGALLSSQNLLRLNTQGGLRKRGGLESFVDTGANAILALLNVALVPAPLTDPETGIEVGEGDPMYCKLYKSANQAINNASLTTVTFDSEDFDVGNLHDTAVNNSRITIPAGGAGLWLFVATCSWGGRNAAGGRTGAYVYKNGTTRIAIAEETPDAASGDGNLGTTFSAVCFDLAVAGDYYEMQVRQDSGGSLNLLGASEDLASFAAARLRSTV